MKKAIKFNVIFIIQSLSPSERQTGNEIAQQVKYACLRRALDPMEELINIEGRADFFELMSQIAELVEHGVRPYVHFEMHGSPLGLSLKSGEHASWEELKEPIRRINIASENNLYVSLATCHGANFLDLYKGEFDKPCPFYGYIGATEVMDAFDFEVSFTSFFQALLTDDNITSGIEALMSVLPVNRGNYIFIDCEDYQKELMKIWNNDYGSLAGKQKYFRYLVNLARQRFPQVQMTKERKKELERFVYGKYMDEYFTESKAVFLHQKIYSGSFSMIDFLNQKEYHFSEY
jgi:hypothetical protein